MAMFLNIIILFLACQMNTSDKEIYSGKSLLFIAYYDSIRLYPVIEMSGPKYTYHDHLKYVTKNENGIIAISNIGKLYKKKDQLYYYNKTWNTTLKLKLVKYSELIDKGRDRIFRSQAYLKVSRITDSLKIIDRPVDWGFSEDFITYKTNKDLPADFEYNYMKKLKQLVRNVKSQ